MSTTITARYRFADEGGVIKQGERLVTIEVFRSRVKFTELATGRVRWLDKAIFDKVKKWRLVEVVHG